MLVLVVTIAMMVVVNGQFSWATLGPYSYQSKRILPGVFTGGRLTETQLKLLANAQFATVLSVAMFPDNNSTFNGVVGEFPSSAREAQIVESVGMKMVQLDNIALDAASSVRFNQALLAAKKPVYVHCYVGYQATLFSLLYEYATGALIGASGSASVYNVGISNGWDYQANSEVVSMVNSVTGAKTAVTAPSIDLLLNGGQASYKNYYWTHRVGNDHWYNTGQILSTHIPAIAAAGYKAVISFRVNGESTTHVNPTDCSTPTSACPDNQQFMNPDGTYNVDLERAAVEAAGIRFYNLPVSDNSWNAATLAQYASVLAEAAATGGPVLTHCKSGYRSSAFVVAYLAQMNKKCVLWATQQATEIGYSYDADGDTEVIDFFSESLKC